MGKCCIEGTQHLQVCSLPAQNPRQPPPTPPLLPQVANHRKPVVVSRRQHSPQIFKCQYILDRLPVGLEGPLRNIPRLRLRQLSSLPIRPFFTLCCAQVLPVQGPPGDQHVALGAPWVGGVSFLQNHHSVENMPVHKVHLHRRPRHHSARAPRHWICPWSSLRREGYPVILGSNLRGRCAPLPPYLASLLW